MKLLHGCVLHGSSDRLAWPRRSPDRRAWARLLACSVLLVAAPLSLGGPARAASTGTTVLFMPQGSQAEEQFGDYISSSVNSNGGGCLTGPSPGVACSGNPINTIYRYYVEVPAGLTHLRIQVYDADIGAGGTAEAVLQRDRTRGTFNTTVKYTLLRPDGTQAATFTCTATATAFCKDADWGSLIDTTTTPIQAGHWEVDVDQSSAQDPTNGADINAFGLRADDGDATSGGTEIPVYYLAHTQIGQNPPSSGSGTKTYNLYPYVTSGCNFNENDFDYDLDNGNSSQQNQNVGSIAFTSRSGNFTKNIAATSLSFNDAWNTNNVSGYTTDSDSVDYGIWAMAAAISNYTNASGINGNYANVYVTNSSASGAPANNSPTANSFRVYLPTDGGSAPVKPYLEQEARYVGTGAGPNPPAVGSTTLIQITVQVVNPAAAAITFSATNLVTVNVPGAGATYGGNAAVTQGTIVSQPAVNGTGNITWNPGTVAAGATALLTYQVKVTPTSAGQRIPVVGTVASGNGTKGVWVDETGNTTQARATLTFGPLCELAATAGVISAAEVVDLRATATRHGVLVEWQTAAEIAAAGFDLYREDEATHRWRKVNRALVPALLGAPQGGTYRVLDEEAPARAADQPLRYTVVETETRGAIRHYPFQVTLQDGRTAAAQGDSAEALAAALAADGGAARSARIDPAWAARFGAVPAQSAPLLAEAAGIAGAGANPSLEIGVRGSGLYRLDPSVFVPLLGPATKLGNLLLTNQGSPVAYTIDAGGGVLFYGQASTSIYSRDNVYWLSAGRGVLMRTASGGNPTSTGSPSAAFANTVHSEQEAFAATTVPANPDSDYWYWDYLIAGDPASGSKSFTATAPNVTTGGGSVTVHLAGALAAQNHVQVSLNGTPLGDTTWPGAVPHAATFPVTGWNTAGANTVGLTAVLDPGVSSSIVYLQSIDAGYPRSYTALGDALSFTGSGNSPVTVSGFSGPAISVFDVSKPRLPAVLNGTLIDTVGGGSRVTLVPSTATTSYFAAGPGAVLAPAWTKAVPNVFAARQPSGADYLILTTSDLAAAANSLAALRAAQGLRTAVVDVADVMNAFNFGQSSPHALQTFLRFVRVTWNPVPRYVVLAGAGTFDYLDNQGFGGNLVPPLMVNTADGLFASDSHLADVDGSGVPAFAIGRLPVASAAELQAYADKVAEYEGNPGGSWAAQALMLADETGPNDGVTNFAGDSTDLAATLPPGYAPQQIVVTPGGVAGARGALFSGLAAGAGLVNYVGHAGLDRLSPEGLLTTADVPTMSQGPRLPVLAALTCSVNRFDVPGFSPLGQLAALQPHGGAIVVWSSSGSSVHPEGKALGRMFTYALADPANLRFGDVVQEALKRYARSQGLVETLQLYTVLGDPAILLKPVTPPGSLAASSNVRE